MAMANCLLRLNWQSLSTNMHRTTNCEWPRSKKFNFITNAWELHRMQQYTKVKVNQTFQCAFCAVSIEFEILLLNSGIHKIMAFFWTFWLMVFNRQKRGWVPYISVLSFLVIYVLKAGLKKSKRNYKYRAHVK